MRIVKITYMDKELVCIPCLVKLKRRIKTLKIEVRKDA